MTRQDPGLRLRFLRQCLVPDRFGPDLREQVAAVLQPQARELRIELAAASLAHGGVSCRDAADVVIGQRHVHQVHEPADVRLLVTLGQIGEHPTVPASVRMAQGVGDPRGRAQSRRKPDGDVGHAREHLRGRTTGGDEAGDSGSHLASAPVPCHPGDDDPHHRRPVREVHLRKPAPNADVVTGAHPALDRNRSRAAHVVQQRQVVGVGQLVAGPAGQASQPH